MPSGSTQYFSAKKSARARPATAGLRRSSGTHKSRFGAFHRLVWSEYKKHGRHDLPWRQTQNPYHILVSEMMLQQTQAGRVIPFYTRFLRLFPNIRALARSPLSKVLRAWQGLGYNRRAKALLEAAREVVGKHEGVIPKEESALVALPGVGSYSARALLAFAYNSDVVVIETNIRTAVLHHFFQSRETVQDAKIMEILSRALPKGRARAWNWALMDYGAFLKGSGVRLNHRAKTYKKQSRFQGSTREARGGILRALSRRSQSASELYDIFGKKRRAQMRVALGALCKERLVEKDGLHYRLSRQ